MNELSPQMDADLRKFAEQYNEMRPIRLEMIDTLSGSDNSEGLSEIFKRLEEIYYS